MTLPPVEHFRGRCTLPPAHKVDKAVSVSGAEDSRSTEAARAPSVDDKLRALKQYRRACGLCDRCAEKWVYGHKCAATVQLHAIQELWELLPEEDHLETHSNSSDDQSGQL
jgi:hypothetical protein